MDGSRAVVIDAKRSIRTGSYLFFFCLIAIALFLIHAPLLKLPFYWDELGQFVPASLDLFQGGEWIPYTTVPNIHPPGVMAYLAATWHLTGYSIASTRAAMLLLASFGAFCAFLLAITLSEKAPGHPPFTALALLCLSPLFVAQSMMVQLDMPAMSLTCLALLLFLHGHLRRSAFACVALVMIKETGLVLPLVLGAWLAWERRLKESVLFFLGPLLPLAVWLVVLDHATGHWAGNASFEAYNAFYQLHPVRFLLALLRRLYYLFIGTGHFIGTAAIVYAWKRSDVFRSRSWAGAASYAAAHVLVVSLFGGAVLERYLMPVLPLLYVAFAVALSTLEFRWRILGIVALACMLVTANFVNPPYPFPMENNLAFVSFVSLDQRAAEFVESRYAGTVVATTFPLAGVLRRPEFGYVTHPIQVREIDDFRRSEILALRGSHIGALVLYSIVWDPLGLLDNSAFAEFLSRFYGYKPQASSGAICEMLHMHPVARWTQAGQWVEVLESYDFQR